MDDILQKQMLDLINRFVGYLPNLIAGILMVLIGWIFAWLAKRVIVQLSVILHLERYLLRSRWGNKFSRADVRFGLYNFIGNIVFFFVLLIFINNALIFWKLDILSKLLGSGIIFLPKIIVSVIVFAAGWFISNWAETSIARELRREEIARSSFIAKFIKIVLMIFFSTIALIEMNLAKEIVTIAFATVFITLGAIAVIMTARGGNIFIKNMGNSPGSKKTAKLKR